MSRYIGYNQKGFANSTVSISGTTETGLQWDTSTNTSYYTYDDVYQVKRSGSASWGYVAISSATFSSGKYSVDFKVNSASGGTKRTNIGIIKSGQESSGGSNWLSKPFGSSTSYSAGRQDGSYSTNDYFTLNVDFDSGTLELLQNNSSSGTDTFTTGGNWHISFQEYDNTSEFEIQDQIYAAPSGYTKLTRTTGISSTGVIYSDTKFLSGIWDITDVRDKMMLSTWISNDSRIPNGAGLQDSNHRWYGTGNPSGPGGGGGGGGTSVTFKVWGAGGAGGRWGGGSAGSGGSGGFAKGTLASATPGTTYNVVVGSNGVVGGSSNSAPEGGKGAGYTAHPSHEGGAGGGFSGVFEGPISIGNAIIIAGGGGGGGSYDRSGEDESGGGGGGSTGQDAANPGPAIGKGGTQSAGGSPYGGGGAGSALQGGNADYQFSMAGGGGGGGYYGGSGGGVDGSSDAEETSGGGGGSGYVAPALSDTANLQGVAGTAAPSAQEGQKTAINPTASSDPDYTGSYGQGGRFNTNGNPGYVVITSPSGSTTFTSPGTYNVP